MNDYLIHRGVGHLDGGHSGRYPWGSGDSPYQSEGGKSRFRTNTRKENKYNLKRSKAKELTKRTGFYGNMRDNITDKKFNDKVIKRGSTIQTLSADKDRLKNADMFFATYDKLDRDWFMAKFNNKVTGTEKILDENGKPVKTVKYHKFSIEAIAKTDIKVASRDNIDKSFIRLYSKDKDFRDYVTNPKRMLKVYRMTPAFNLMHLIYPVYAKARLSLSKSRINKNYKPTKDELRALAEMFTLIMPSDGRGNQAIANDVKLNRGKLFSQLQKEGYGAYLDSYDSIYHDWKRKVKAPVVVFDMKQIIPSAILHTTLDDINKAKKEYIGDRRKW